MVSPGAVFGVVLLLAIHTLIAAIATRFIRLFTETRLGCALAIGLVIPTILLFSTQLLSGVFHMGFDVQEPWIAAMLSIGLPLALGVTIDFLWVASPAEVERALGD